MTSGGANGQLKKVVVEDLVPDGSQVPEAGARPLQGWRLVPEEGGTERSNSSSSVSGCSSSSNTGRSPTSGGASGQSNKVGVEDLVPEEERRH